MSPAGDTGPAGPGQVWDRRYTEEGWSADPDPYLVELAGPLPPGRGMDLGAGPGRNSLWLAARGWDMTLVDASAVGLSQAAAGAEARGSTVRTVQADVFVWRPPEAEFDLVIVANLHPGPEPLAGLLAGAAQALRPGGHLYVVGRHVDDLGRRGPRDPDRLLTDERLRAALPAALEVQLLASRPRRVGPDRPGAEDPTGTVVLAWATRPAGPTAAQSGSIPVQR